MGGLTLGFAVVEEQGFSSSRDGKDGRCASMETSVWESLPLDLEEKVLLFLPPSSQTRFRSVCKRWRKLIKSATFQEEASVLRNDYVLCLLQLPGLKSPLGELTTKSLKVHMYKLQVDMPGLMIPSHFSSQVFSNADLVVVTSWNWKSPVEEAMRCWLLDIANQSWRELPRLALCVLVNHWNVWVAGSETDNFQVSVIMWTADPNRSTLHTYSDTSTTWRTLDIPQVATPVSPWNCSLSKLGYILVDYVHRLWLWEGTSAAGASPPKLTPLPSERRIRTLSHPDTDVVFGVTWFGHLERFKLFRLDGSSGQWKWKCVVSELPQGCEVDARNWFQIKRSRIVGNKVLIQVVLGSESSSWGSLFLTYHILSGCYGWLSSSAFPNDELWKLDCNSWIQLGLMDPATFFKLCEPTNIN